MNILITGGSGFLGGCLSKFLSRQHNITLCSSSLLKHPSWLKDCNFSNIYWFDKESISKVCKNQDLIIHAAGMNAQACFSNPKKAFEFNSELTNKLLGVAIDNNVAKFYYFSTAHVYCCLLYTSPSPRDS